MVRKTDGRNEVCGICVNTAELKARSSKAVGSWKNEVRKRSRKTKFECSALQNLQLKNSGLKLKVLKWRIKRKKMKNRIRQKGICDFKDVRIHFRLSTDAAWPTWCAFDTWPILEPEAFRGHSQIVQILLLERFTARKRRKGQSQRPIVRWLRVANKRLLQIIAHFTDCRNNRHCSPLASY